MCLCICLFVQLVVIFSTVFKSTYITLIVVLKKQKEWIYLSITLSNLSGY